MTVIATPAAGLILLRDAPRLEVLMTVRHQAMGFAGGALVFPGGKIDPADRNTVWAAHCEGWDNLHTEWRAAAVAAIREAFEEAGILLARSADGGELDAAQADALRAAWGGRLKDSNDAFLTMVRSADLKLATDRLVRFAHWIAPPGLHKRFDTRFFAALCPARQTAAADGGEAVEAVWVAPAEALADAAAGNRRLIFPTKRKLELLALADTAEATLARAAARAVEPIMPDVAMRDGEPWLTIPPHLGYPVTEEPLSASTRG